MGRFFQRNLELGGRLVRAVMAVLFLAGAVFCFGESFWLGLALAAAGVFGLVEASLGWCAVRACGVRTRF